MTKNPILNALLAAGYIGLIAAAINFLSLTQSDKPDTAFAPVVFLSLLTLSVTVMAFAFFYQPLQLFIEGKKKKGIDLFVKTVGAFAVLTAIFLALLFAGVI